MRSAFVEPVLLELGHAERRIEVYRQSVDIQCNERDSANRGESMSITSAFDLGKGGVLIHPTLLLSIVGLLSETPLHSSHFELSPTLLLVSSMATKYKKLTEKDVLDLSAAMKKIFRWDSEPRLFQLKAVQAQLEGIDIVVQAPTGAGKTAIAAGPHVWPTMKGRITLMISPLLALENEMVKIPIVKCNAGRETEKTFRWIHSE